MSLLMALQTSKSQGETEGILKDISARIAPFRAKTHNLVNKVDNRRVSGVWGTPHGSEAQLTPR